MNDFKVIARLLAAATCKPLNKAAAQIQGIDENIAAKVVQAQINTIF